MQDVREGHRRAVDLSHGELVPERLLGEVRKVKCHAGGYDGTRGVWFVFVSVSAARVHVKAIAGASNSTGSSGEPTFATVQVIHDGGPAVRLLESIKVCLPVHQLLLELLLLSPLRRQGDCLAHLTHEAGHPGIASLLVGDASL